MKSTLQTSHMADQNMDSADVESASSSETSSASIFSPPAFFSEATPATPSTDQTPARQPYQRRTRVARTTRVERSDVPKYVPTLFHGYSSSGSDGSSSDDPKIDFERNFLPPRPRASDPTTRRSPFVERRSQPLPAPSSLFETAILDLNGVLPSPTCSTTQGSTASDSRTHSMTTSPGVSGAQQHFLPDSDVSSPLALAYDPAQRAYVEPFSIPLPCGFEHAGLKLAFDSIDSLIGDMNLATAEAGSGRQPTRSCTPNPKAEEPSLSKVNTSLAMRIPSEILNQIYLHLHPSDANAARHTCRSWMNASLNPHVLGQMLRRGAWMFSFRHFTKHRNVSLTIQTLETTWLMSCFLTRECALSGKCRGNGLPLINTAAVTTCDHHWGHRLFHTCTTPRRSVAKAVAFREVTHVKFDELACGQSQAWLRSSLLFEASVCGQYILVAEGSMIHVYKLHGAVIRALTSIMCPRQVLAMSMDVTSRRLTVAALLEGRMGIMCSFQLGLKSGRNTRRGRPNSIVTDGSPSSVRTSS